ncbi:Beta-ketoadipyl-CoA thiolase [Methylibium sp. T29-B]|nr:Beta-ketoadipyl-CoA thiolase [Methylibium sp. T29-B]
MATTGVAPRLMGIGPAPASQRVLQLTGLTLAQMDVIELNEAFAAQGLAVLRQLGLADDDARVNPNGGAIALGHPLGASGARLITTAIHQLHDTRGATPCARCASGSARALRWCWSGCEPGVSAAQRSSSRTDERALETQTMMDRPDRRCASDSRLRSAGACTDARTASISAVGPQQYTCACGGRPCNADAGSKKRRAPSPPGRRRCR